MNPARHLTLKLSLSKANILLFASIIVGSYFIVLLVDISWLVKIALYLLIASYSLPIIRKYCFLATNDAILQCHYLDEKGWFFARQNGRFFTVKVLGESVVTRWLCVLRFCQEGSRKKQTCLIFKDAILPDEYRKMLSILRNY